MRRPRFQLLFAFLFSMPILGIVLDPWLGMNEQAIAFAEDDEKEENKPISDKKLFAEDDKQKKEESEKKEDEKKDENKEDEKSEEKEPDEKKEEDKKEEDDEEKPLLNADDVYKKWNQDFENEIFKAITAELQAEMDETNKQLDERLAKYEELQIEIELLRLKFDRLLQQRKEWKGVYDHRNPKKEEKKDDH